MPRKLPLHVVREISRHGKVKYFFRRGKGKRVRLPDDLSSREFADAYASAMAGQPIFKNPHGEANKESLRWLFDRYRESATWRAYSAATRKQQTSMIMAAIDRSRNASFHDIDKRAMISAMEARADKPASANNFYKAMRALFKWAVTNDHVTINPTDGVDRIKYKTDGFTAWTMADYQSFCRKWPIGSRPRLACELLLHSGLRRSDIVRAGRQHMAGNIFTIRTEKTGAVITVEFPPHLVDIINRTETGDLSFIVNDDDRPYTKESFGNWFGEKCREAGLRLNAHGLRKLSATLSANAGAAAHELMAQYGWSTIQQAEVYTKRADRIALGIRSSRRVADQIENEKSLTGIQGAGMSRKAKDNQ